MWVLCGMIRPMEYTVVKIQGQNGREKTFETNTTAMLNEMAAAGWRLVCVDMFWGYFERDAS